MSRADGYPGFSKAYGLNFAEVREMDLSLTYIALSSRQVDLIAGNSTEGRIAQLDLVQLADDQRYFPPYEAVYLVRQDTLARVPQLQRVLAETRQRHFDRRDAPTQLRDRWQQARSERSCEDLAHSEAILGWPTVTTLSGR